MKAYQFTKMAFISGIMAITLTACNDKNEKAEEEAEAGVGTVYDTTQQGVEHENRDNQFPDSRNDNMEGNGLETGAPSDTTDNDGDRGTKPMKQ